MNKVFEGFQEIIDLQTMLGENQFRIRAYANALKVMKGLGQVTDVKQVQGLKGFGSSTISAISQLLQTGTCDRLEELRKKAPPSTVAQFQKIPGVGPKGALKIFQEYAVATLEELQSLIATGSPGVQKYKEGVEFALRASERTPIGYILPKVTPVLNAVKELPLVHAAEFAGSLRRRKETIRDVDILVSVKEKHWNIANLAKLRSDTREVVAEVLGDVKVEAEGERKIRARDNEGLQIDFLFVPSLEWGAALQYFTGSKEHNIELRKRAADRGWRLNEKVLVDGRGVVLASETEEDIYRALGVPMLPPELRQDGTEVGKSVPENLITPQDLAGTLHNHTSWSDGRDDIATMVDAAIQSGHRYIAITDHTKAMAIANGMNEEKWVEQHELIKASEYGIRVYHSAEMDVLGDGTCDYPLSLIEEMDFVLLALHRQPQRNIVERFVKAMHYLRDNLKSDKTIILAHPSGRKFGTSEVPNIDWDELFAQCALCNVVLEINSTPQRLDLPDSLCRRAKEKYGLKFSISTDSHAANHLKFLELGVNVARRAWLERDDVINTKEDLFV